MLYKPLDIDPEVLRARCQRITGVGGVLESGAAPTALLRADLDGSRRKTGSVREHSLADRELAVNSTEATT